MLFRSSASIEAGIPTNGLRIGRGEMAKEFNVVIERDAEGFYVTSVPVLPGCHTQAKSLDQLMARIREAIELCLEVSPKILRDCEMTRRCSDRCCERMGPTMPS